MNIILRASLGILLMGAALPTFAQTLHQDIQGVWHAEVVEVVDSRTEILPPDGIETFVQTIQVELREGPRKGEVIEFENDYIQLEEGQKFFVSYYEQINGATFYTVHSVDRRGALLGLLGVFVAVLLLFSGKQGLRSLLALSGSIFVILYILVPSLVSGYPPVITSVSIAIVILFCAIFFTHGFNRRALIAFAGTSIAIIITGVLALVSINLSQLTGFASDESVYLNFNTGGTLDFVGLLLAGMIIGALGVLDDIAITQVSVVREIRESNPDMSTWEVYFRALRVGREHIGALVNTLVLAYTGAALPVLMLFSQSASGFGSIINQEVFATEIVRTLVGSIGLILTVPITTILAVYIKRGKNESDHGHSHGHSHVH